MNQQFDFSTLHVFVPGKISFSTAEIGISATSLSFNATAAAELDYPGSVCVMVADDASYLAIKACEDPKLAVPFCTEIFKEKRKRICIREKNFVGALRDRLVWDEKTRMKANGVLYREAGMLVFELSKAIPVGARPARKWRPSIKDYPTLTDVVQILKPRVLALGPVCENSSNPLNAQ